MICLILFLDTKMISKEKKQYDCRSVTIHEAKLCLFTLWEVSKNPVIDWINLWTCHNEDVG